MEKIYFENTCDYVLNLYGNQPVMDAIFSISKSYGEGTMTMQAFQYIQENNIVYDKFFKISGRYWLDYYFYYYNFISEKSGIAYIENNPDNVCTALYFLSIDHSKLWFAYLQGSINEFFNCTGYEEIFASFIKTLPENDVNIFSKIGVTGYIAPFGNVMEM
jgi:hypothetical protein